MPNLTCRKVRSYGLNPVKRLGVPYFIPILACGNVGITTGDIVLLLFVAASWIIAFCLCLANLAIIFRGSQSVSFKLIHSVILTFYIGIAIFLFNLQKIITNNDKAAPIGMVLTIAIPLIVISHFIYLLIYWRRLKHETKKDT